MKHAFGALVWLLACGPNEPIADTCTAPACTGEDATSHATSGDETPASPTIEVASDCFDATSDAITLVRVAIEGDVLLLDVGHSGGCAEHGYRLCADPVLLRSEPAVQRFALVHDANGDMCEAYLTTTLRVPVGALPHAPIDVESTSDRTFGLSVR
ncbi:MAG: hypothetical protein H6721_13790 [Sandaracinus sp.]|nr:hypothetical protein [Sandaracinus sp.]MCB9633188.1 hypothetical protein [Sandaracinus sp.]